MGIWKEYALDPDLFDDFYRADAFLSGLGFEHGRLLGPVPSDWLRRIRDAANERFSPIQQQKIIGHLEKLRRAVRARNLAFNDALPWVDQALDCHRLKAFDAILLNGAHEDPVVVDASNGAGGLSCWQNARRYEVERTAEALGRALRPLLERAYEVIVVDPYFNPSMAPGTSKWLRPLRALSECLAGNRQLRRFEVNTLSPAHDAWPLELFFRHCAANIPPTLPNELRVNLRLWERRPGGLQFHERLIATDLGGVLLDPGLDDGNEGETYTLRLLGRDESLEYLDKFEVRSSPYNLLGEQEYQNA